MINEVKAKRAFYMGLKYIVLILLAYQLLYPVLRAYPSSGSVPAEMPGFSYSLVRGSFLDCSGRGLFLCRAFHITIKITDIILLHFYQKFNHDPCFSAGRLSQLSRLP